jgi:hypothetical protein
MAVTKQKKTVAWDGRITNIQANVLVALARYQYLSFSMMLEIGVGTSVYQYLWKQVSSLRDRRKALVACHNYSTPQPKRGKVESLYYLTMSGKKALMEELHLYEYEIKKPSNKAVAYKDYHHRKDTIRFHIHMDKWAKANGFDIPFFDTYFEKSAAAHGALMAKTRIDLKSGNYLIPDAAFKIIAETSDKFYLFELHRGNNTGRLIEQLHHHAQAMTTRATHGKYGLPINKGYYIILLFEFEVTKEAFLNRMKREGEAFQEVGRYFLVNDVGEIQKGDFGDGWRTVLGEDAVFF